MDFKQGAFSNWIHIELFESLLLNSKIRIGN